MWGKRPKKYFPGPTQSVDTFCSDSPTSEFFRAAEKQTADMISKVVALQSNSRFTPLCVVTRLSFLARVFWEQRPKDKTDLIYEKLVPALESYLDHRDQEVAIVAVRTLSELLQPRDYGRYTDKKLLCRIVKKVDDGLGLHWQEYTEAADTFFYKVESSSRCGLPKVLRDGESPKYEDYYFYERLAKAQVVNSKVRRDLRRGLSQTDSDARRYALETIAQLSSVDPEILDLMVEYGMHYKYFPLKEILREMDKSVVSRAIDKLEPLLKFANSCESAKLYELLTETAQEHEVTVRIKAAVAEHIKAHGFYECLSKKLYPK